MIIKSNTFYLHALEMKFNSTSNNNKCRLYENAFLIFQEHNVFYADVTASGLIILRSLYFYF